MTSRGTLALVAFAIALGLYVWLVEIRGAEQKVLAESAARIIFAINPASVTALTLPTADGRTARVVRASEREWRLESPVAYPADSDAVGRALRVLEGLEQSAVIEPKPADLEAFGLGAARKTIEVSAGEGAPRSLFVGASTPVGGGRYLELASDPKRIFSVPAASIADLEPALIALRDKRLLRLPTQEISELTVRSGGALVARAVKGDAGWSLVEPLVAAADVEKIVRVLDDLALARASGFEDQPLPRESYGLVTPAREVSVRAGEVEERLAIAFRDGKTWLERAGDPVVLEVNERVLSNVPANFFDYRAKRVLTLDVESVHALELAFPRSGQSQRLKRDGEAWGSESAGVVLKPVVVEDLLFAIAALDATSALAAPAERAPLGLEPPLARIRAYDQKGALLGELSFGDPQPDTGLPALSSQSPDVWRVSNDIGREVPLSPEAFTNLLVQTPPAPAPAPLPSAAPEAPATP